MIKKFVITLPLLGGLCGNSYAGIPTIDAVSNITRAIEFAQTVVQWGVELEEMRRHYDQMREEYRAMNGSRNWGNTARNDYEANSDTWNETLNDTNYDAVADAARLVGIDEAAFDPASPAAIAMQNQQNTNAFNRVVSEESFNRAQARLANLEELVDSINSATDQKDIQDVQARIQAEQVLLQNEQARMTMVAALQQNQRDIAEQQNRERLIQMSRPVQVVW